MSAIGTENKVTGELLCEPLINNAAQITDPTDIEFVVLLSTVLVVRSYWSGPVESKLGKYCRVTHMIRSRTWTCHAWDLHVSLYPTVLYSCGPSVDLYDPLRGHHIYARATCEVTRSLHLCTAIAP